MATIKRFEDLVAWEKARELSKVIYLVSKEKNFAMDFDLKRQMRRAGGSVMDNISEGFERGGKGEFIQFLGIAKGSVGEIRSQLYRALDQKYIDKDKFDQMYNQANDISKIINGLITYLRNSKIKGRKYK